MIFSLREEHFTTTLYNMHWPWYEFILVWISEKLLLCVLMSIKDVCDEVRATNHFRHKICHHLFLFIAHGLNGVLLWKKNIPQTSKMQRLHIISIWVLNSTIPKAWESHQRCKNIGFWKAVQHCSFNCEHTFLMNAIDLEQFPINRERLSYKHILWLFSKVLTYQCRVSFLTSIMFCGDRKKILFWVYEFHSGQFLGLAFLL